MVKTLKKHSNRLYKWTISISIRKLTSMTRHHKINEDSVITEGLGIVGMDVLTNVLDTTRLGNTVYCKSEFIAPWAVQFPAENRASFHIINRGICWFCFDDGTEAVQLGQGDVLLVPHRASYSIGSQQGIPAQPLSEVLAELKSNNFKSKGDGVSTVITCGGYHFTHEGQHPLLSLLPSLIHIPADAIEDNNSFLATLHLLSKEMNEPSPGSNAMLTRLVDMLFINTIRTWLAQQPELSAGWLGALRDTQIGKALTLIHDTPEKNWTVVKLANEVSLSRAAFAKRFSSLVGEPPLTYLTKWRMDIAARLLRESETSLLSIAQRVGYETESSFSKAFQRAFAIPPGQYRTARN